MWTIIVSKEYNFTKDSYNKKNLIKKKLNENYLLITLKTH